MPFASLPAVRIRARRSRLLATTVLVCVFAPSGWTIVSAQDAASVTELPAVVVTSPTTVPTPVDQVASTVTVITAADIEREQRRTVPDVLQIVPGLNVVQTGGPGGTTSVFMRGTNSNHVKVLIDGIDMGDATTGTPDISQLLTGDIERIEVLRGPQSGLYGSDAIGGVIAITTKKGAGPAKARASLEGGSFGTFNQTASVSGSHDKFNYAFNFAHFRSTSTPATPDRLLPAGQQASNSLYDNKTASVRLGYDFNDNLSVNWIGRYTDAKYRYTGDDPSQWWIGTFPAAEQSNQASHQFTTRGEAVWTLLDGRVKNYFGVNYTDLYRSIYDPWQYNSTTWTYGPGASSYNSERLKYDWRSVVQVMAGQTLVLGADKQTEYYKDDTPLKTQVGDKGAYVELQSEFAKRLFLVSNVRHDDHDTFGGHTTYRFAPAVLVPGTETKLKASYGIGFKAPSLYQLYNQTYGNAGLKPEESTGWDAGFEQPIAGDIARFGATYFHNDITNIINTAYTGGKWQYENVALAKTYGVEAFGSWAVTSRVKLRGDYTYTEASNVQTGEQLKRRPKHKGSVSAIFTPTDQWQLSATILRIGEWLDVDRSTYADVWMPRYTLVNIAAEYKVNEQATVFGRVDNLFNKRYEDPNGFLKTGIGVFGGVRVATP